MTTIYLRTTDQVLAVSQRPKIAAGDVESVKLHVEFDSMWDKYTGKTAVFHTSNDATRYEALLLQGECTVPHEVLHKEGTLFIGVRGVSTDGTAIKTTTLVKQKIVKGADTGAKTLLPSPDIYQQYIEETGKRINPIVEDEIDKWDKRVQQRENQLNEFLITALTTLSGDVLWTNEDPTQEIGTYTSEEMDLKDYERIKIIFKHSTSEDIYTTCECTEKGKSFVALSCGSSRNNIRGRNVEFTDKGFYFSNGYDIDTSGTSNNYCVPCKIIAYKY